MVTKGVSKNIYIYTGLTRVSEGSRHSFGDWKKQMERWIQIEVRGMQRTARGGTRARVRKKEVMAAAQGKYAPIIRAILKSA